MVPRIRSLSPAPSTQRGFDPANITAADRQHFYHDLDRWGARTPRNEAFNWGVLACQSIHIIRRSDGELTTDDLKNMEQNMVGRNVTLYDAEMIVSNAETDLPDCF